MAKLIYVEVFNQLWPAIQCFGGGRRVAQLIHVEVFERLWPAGQFLDGGRGVAQSLIQDTLSERNPNRRCFDLWVIVEVNSGRFTI